MKRPVKSARFPSISAVPPPGYTLVEILVATVLTLIMVAAAVKIFGDIGQSVSDSRATLEMSDRLRAARIRLEMDLAGVTATMLPPLRPENGEGYFQYTEGLVGPALAPSDVAKNTEDPSNTIDDSTVGDFDDVLMFTTHSADRPFMGRVLLKRAPLAGETPDGNENGSYVLVKTADSDIAEVAWFVRGRTLYRRMLLVRPPLDVDLRTAATEVPTRLGFYRNYDLSVHWDGSKLVGNTLGDLTKHECRFAHDPDPQSFPCHPHALPQWAQLGLPTLCECSFASWAAGAALPTIPLTADGVFDAWTHPHPWNEVDPQIGVHQAFYDPTDAGQRIAEDVILTNVIGFDVKAWDPVAGAYVDLGYEANPSLSPFSGPGDPKSGMIRVYDTWSFHYEHDGIDQDGDGLIDEGTNGFDDDGNGVVDDPGEMETTPPYPVPLRAIQVKIRVYEPDSRQIREVTVVQEFLPK